MMGNKRMHRDIQNCSHCRESLLERSKYCGACGAPTHYQRRIQRLSVIAVLTTFVFLTTIILWKPILAPLLRSRQAENPFEAPVSLNELMQGQDIAFCSNRTGNWEVYLMEPDGTNVRQVTFDGGYDGTPALSPDRDWLAFTTRRNGDWEIYLLNVEGGELSNLTNHPGEDLGPSWSPDGSMLAFSSDRDGNYEIYIMDLSDRGTQRLTYHDSDDTSPAWSPDNATLAFTSDRGRAWDIYLMTTYFELTPSREVVSISYPQQQPSSTPIQRIGVTHTFIQFPGTIRGAGDS